MQVTMVLTYYKLRKHPFSSKIDLPVLWKAGSLGDIYPAVEKGVINNEGVVVVTGDEGLGKSTLLHYLRVNLENDFIVSFIEQPAQKDILQLYQFIAQDLHITRPFSNKSEFLIHLRNKLQRIYAEDKKLVFIVDDAHRIDGPTLKEFFMLSAIGMNEQPLVQIVFAGLPSLFDSLNKIEGSRFSNPTLIQQKLAPFSKRQTLEYIRHRLESVGASPKLFHPAAIRKIHAHTQGNPASIHRICSAALEEGAKTRKKVIRGETVNRCLKTLDGQMEKQHQKDQTDFASDHADRDRTLPRSGKTPWMSKLGLALAVVLIAVFLASTVYVLHDFSERDTRPWRIDEIAPRENSRITRQLREKTSQEALSGSTQPPTDHSPLPLAENPGPASDQPLQAITVDRTTDAGSQQAGSSAVEPLMLDKVIVYFKHDSNELSDMAYTDLNRLAEGLRQRPALSVVVKGFTDSSGQLDYNIAISKQRAEAVASYLHARGVEPARTTTVGLGPQNPLQSNATLEGRRKNRRVEVEVLK